MAEGTIKKLTNKGFGFIDTGTEKDLFFHSSSLQGVSYEELVEGQRVSFNEARGEKGPCAENVTLVWRSEEANSYSNGEVDMGDKGSKDKGKREQQKKAQLTPKEKRKRKKDKKNK